MKKTFTGILTIVFLVAVGAALYFYREVTVLKQSPQVAAEEEAEELVSVVGRLIILPKDEVPTVATVTDPSKLADQPFFAKAKVGDKVLIYTQARKAYLYDPVANKILEVAPININTEDGFETATETSVETVPQFNTEDDTGFEESEL